MFACNGETNKKGWTKSKLLYQYRPLHSCLFAESYIKNFMNFRDRGCVRTLRPLFVYATVWNKIQPYIGLYILPNWMAFSSNIYSLCGESHTSLIEQWL